MSLACMFSAAATTTPLPTTMLLTTRCYAAARYSATSHAAPDRTPPIAMLCSYERTAMPIPAHPMLLTTARYAPTKPRRCFQQPITMLLPWHRYVPTTAPLPKNLSTAYLLYYLPSTFFLCQF
eukprot:3907473-Rhodomonas_salina.2